MDASRFQKPDPFERHQRSIERANNKNQHGEPETDPAHNRAELSESTEPPNEQRNQHYADRQSRKRSEQGAFVLQGSDKHSSSF